MYLKVEEFSKILKDIAPPYLCESYDNVGLMVGEKTDTITNVLAALDIREDVIAEAKEKNCNLILTHHPLIFNKPSSISDKTVQGRNIIKLIKNGINVYSMHTNLDSVKGGINDIFTELIGIKNVTIIDKKNITDYDKIEKYDPSGIGRIGCFDNPISLYDLCNLVKKNLGIEKLRYCGSLDSKIIKVALINGSGSDYFRKASSLGVQCIITGDTTYHYVQEAEETGMSVIDAGHFETEWVPFKIFCNRLSEYFRKLSISNEIIISDKCRQVYNYI